MKYLLFNWDELEEDVNDPSELSDSEFEELAKKYGTVIEDEEEFEAEFNAEMFSTHTHQLRIIS